MTIRTEVDDDHIILSSSQQLYFCGSSTTLYADAEDDDGDDGDSYSDGEDGCFDPLHTSWLLAHFYADEAALQLVNCLLMIMMMILIMILMMIPMMIPMMTLMMIVLMAITVLMAHPLYTSWLAHFYADEAAAALQLSTFPLFCTFLASATALLCHCSCC